MLRFLLGVAEAGFFPGVILYLTYWYPAHYRAIIVGIFMVAIPVAGLVGSPISGAILYMDGMLGLGGWQWIFILEAAPAVLLGIAAFGWLTDRPQNATWLTPEQQQWLIAKLEAERRRVPRVSHESVWRVMSNRYVLIMALVYSGAVGASTSLALWMPQLVKSFGLTNWQTGLVTAVPFGIAAVWMILWGRSSDRSGERVWHNALPLMWMVLAMLATFFAIGSLWAMIPLLTLIAAGTYASKGPFWALSSEWLGAASAAAGLAQINALGNLSGFFFNYLIGWIQAETGSFPLAMMPIAARGHDRHDLRAGDRSPPATHRGGYSLSRMTRTDRSGNASSLCSARVIAAKALRGCRIVRPRRAACISRHRRQSSAGRAVAPPTRLRRPRDRIRTNIVLDHPMGPDQR